VKEFFEFFVGLLKGDILGERMKEKKMEREL
jgi:hypothetical protein